MEPSTLFMISIVGLVIWCFLLINIIEKGSRSKEIELQLKIQSDLLAKMAEKNGIAISEISEILNQQLQKK